MPRPSKTPTADLEPFGDGQRKLFHETPEDAARSLAAAYVAPDGKCRGPKALAHFLRPSLPEDKAHRWFLAACNNERDEKFSGSDWFTMMRIGREQGIHDIAATFADAGYHFIPIEPEDERAELQRRWIASVELQAQIAQRMDRLMGPRR